MSDDAVHIDLDTAPEEVWSLVGDFGGIEAFLSGIDSFRLEGDDRVIGMFGMEIRERLISRDESARSITYSVVDGVPIERHQATISVAPSGAGSTVTWAFEVEPAEMAPIFADTYQKGLEAITKHFA